MPAVMFAAAITLAGSDVPDLLVLVEEFAVDMFFSRLALLPRGFDVPLSALEEPRRLLVGAEIGAVAETGVVTKAVEVGVGFDVVAATIETDGVPSLIFKF